MIDRENCPVEMIVQPTTTNKIRVIYNCTTDLDRGQPVIAKWLFILIFFVVTCASCIVQSHVQCGPVGCEIIVVEMVVCLRIVIGLILVGKAVVATVIR